MIKRFMVLATMLFMLVAVAGCGGKKAPLAADIDD